MMDTLKYVATYGSAEAAAEGGRVRMAEGEFTDFTTRPLDDGRVKLYAIVETP